MSIGQMAIWIAYIGVFFLLARMGKGYDKASSGHVGFIVQSFSYVATYVSAVALIGFGGLAYLYGMQMILIAFGCSILGTFVVYKFYAWRTKECQMDLSARTPANLLALGHKSRALGILLAIMFAIFLSVYASAVVKGAAVMIQGVVDMKLEYIIILFALIVGLAVWWGGFRGVIYTEAMQGAIMLMGILLLAYSVLSQVGVIDGYKALSEVAPSHLANNGYTSISSGGQAYFMFSMVLVTAVAIWAQPQIIQRHFAISDKKEIKKSIWIASGVIFTLLAVMYYACATARLIMPDLTNADTVVPILVDRLLPGASKHLFVLAIASASVSTCTGLFHIAASAITEDIVKAPVDRKVAQIRWSISIIICIIISIATAMLEGQIIAIIHTASWSVIASGTLVPYLALILLKHCQPRAALASSIMGFAACLFCYICLSPNTAVFLIDNSNLDFIRKLPQFLVGFTVSLSTYILLLERKRG